jgi:membrane protein YqaA with SNARE-associated domain
LSVLITTFVVCTLSAIVPVVNAEAYLLALSALLPSGPTWLTALAAAGGQTTGKLVWYAVGWRSFQSAWVQRKLDVGRRRQRYEAWRSTFTSRPLLSRLVLFASATLGLPPLFLLALLAGELRIPLRWVVPMVLIGRTLRFAFLLGLAGQLVSLL